MFVTLTLIFDQNNDGNGETGMPLNGQIATAKNHFNQG
jgi:hypothetical protein